MGLSESDREALADLVETTVGLGIASDWDCRLCTNGRKACPIHVGEAVADSIAATVDQIANARADAAVRAALIEAAIQCLCDEDIRNAVGCICGSEARTDFLRHRRRPPP